MYSKVSQRDKQLWGDPYVAIQTILV